MATQIDGGKFGLEIPELTEARSFAEADSYGPKSRTSYNNAMDRSSALMERVGKFLEKNGAFAVSGCGTDMFGVITSANDSKVPCGVTFYGTKELAESLAAAFPGNKVISAHDGTVVTPAVETLPRQVKTKQAPRPKF